MPVAVMEIRPMRMSMRQRLVSMPVCVARRRRQARMAVEVVPVVVAVRVDVLDGCVSVRVIILAKRQEST